MSVGIAGAGVIRNNTNKGIPIDLIKNGYLTDVKKKDGTILRTASAKEVIVK